MNAGRCTRDKVFVRLISAVLCCAPAAAYAQHNSITDEQRAIVAEMFADAESRSSLRLDSAPSGHDGKFTLRDADGKFSLSIGGYMQTRYLFNLRDDNEQHDSIEPGFTAHRTKLGFSGHALSPAIKYSLLAAHSRSSGAMRLEIALIDLKLDDHRSLAFGQGKIRFLREENISASKQLAADRSLTNAVFTQGFTQFAQVSHTAADWRAFFSISDGFRSSSTAFDERQLPSMSVGPVSGGESDIAVTARFETKSGDAWARFDDFSSAPDQIFATLFGVALHYESGDASTTTFSHSYSFLSWTADLSLEGNGWSAFASVIGAHASDGSNTENTDDYAALVQGSLFLPDADTECFARYDIMFPDQSRGTDDPFDTLTLGFNHYLHSHAAKFTADIQWFLADTNAISGPRPGVGYLSSDQPNELVLRLQFQIIF
jgi:hypothetical protein